MAYEILNSFNNIVNKDEPINDIKDEPIPELIREVI